MNDYKELLADLTAAANRNSNSLNTRDTCRKAAHAIEQLVRERDAAIADLRKVRCCETCANCEMQIVNEHDYCWCEVDADYYMPTDFCDENWQWRGVQE